MLSYYKLIIQKLLIVLSLTSLGIPVSAAPLNLSDSPLFVSQAVPPLTMIVMGRSHKLFYEAYNDASDLDGDGIIDAGYITDPSFKYYGYFDSNKCYTYNAGAGRFDPAAVATNKKCSGLWSGDYLNYLTTSRMDAIRKVLYGGYRSTDSTTQTVLERSFIPQDAHSWGKQFNGLATDGYSISDYTPFAEPAAGKTHLFANTTLLKVGAGEPRLRVLLNTDYNIWQWLSIERPVADSRVNANTTGGTSYVAISPTDYYVRVLVCEQSSGLPVESNCTSYGSVMKPTGLLHDYGENGAMSFGLLTGSWEKNYSGGVLRKNIGSFADEINGSTGQFTNVNGIVSSINKIKIIDFGGSYQHNCGFVFNRQRYEGECSNWGNPIAEMMYETMRYFQGKASPTAAFTYGSGDDVTLGMPAPAWIDPYSTTESCAKPNIILISDLYPSFDSDQVPGSYFGSFSGDLSPSLNVSTIADSIWANEFGASGSYFIGQSGTISNGAPSAKTVSSFSNIRGLAPEEPTKEGSYYSASVAHYGLVNDIHSAEGTQKVATFVVALSSPLPSFEIPINGNTITMVPFAKTVSGCGGVSPNQGNYQPTNTIVDFYVESLTPTTGTFRINFEDTEQGADHDMDVIAKYYYEVVGNTLQIGLKREYQAGGCIQHMGYVISGTNNDGIYLDIKDENNINYFLNTPVGQPPESGGVLTDDTFTNPANRRSFTTSGAGSAGLLKSPLWYTAKWGYFTDTNGNNIPDLTEEWDSDGDGTPDNYFLVTNPSNLATQLSSVLNNILARSTTSSAAALNSGSLSTDTRLYQAVFDTADWSGQLLAFELDPNNGDLLTTGAGPNGSLWDAGAVMNSINPNSRAIITYKPSQTKGVAFRWPSNPANPNNSSIDLTQVAALRLNPDSGSLDTTDIGEDRLNYLRGDNSNEIQNGGTFRDRITDLGDIINSNPLYIGAPNFKYPEIWPGNNSPETSYLTFKGANSNRTPIVAVGANDGMLHIFDADSGTPLLSYVPSAVYTHLSQLTSSNYSHKYFVDGSTNMGDAFFASSWHTVLVGGLNNGGQGIYALDITNPGNFSENNANDIVLWEFTDANDADLGNTYSTPAIVRMADGSWAAVFGNGYNNTASDTNPSATGNAVLYIVDIETGSLIKKLDTGVGSADDPLSLNRPNGLNTPAVVDTNGDAVADYIYAGDLFGNLWKFDVSGSNSNQWDIPIGNGNNKQPLFIAEDASGNRQPITSRPNVSRLDHEVGGLQIYFGTGKYIEVSDKTDMSSQTFYGIEDLHDGNTVTRAQLLQQSILNEVDYGGYTYRITSNLQKDGSHYGWYIDLVYPSQQGERVISDSIIRNGRVIFSTLIPSANPCDFGGTGWLMELEAQNGKRLDYTPFDVNADGSFSSGDYLTNGSDIVPVSGRKSTVGIIPSAGIISTTQKEYKYTPGTSGSIEKIDENIGPDTEGRQSWRQIK